MEVEEKDHFTSNFQGYHKYSLDYINSIFFSIFVPMKKMEESITYFRVMLKNASLNVAALSPSVRPNIAIVIAMAKHAVRSALARNVETKSLGEYQK